jgi:hypothetical protein
MIHSLAHLRRLAVFASLLAAGSGGCIPPGIAWFPDSSGFVYTGGKDKKQLMVFEVGQKKGRALPVKAGSPAWPAVSPDGKRIAVAWVKMGDRLTSDMLTVLVVDRTGKVVHRSRDFKDWLLRGEILQVWWSPRGDKLLISDERWARLYDLKTEKLTRLPGPAVTFGTTAVRPDGKAFLVHDWKGYRLVDWDGKAQAIKPGFSALLFKDEPDERAQMLRFPLFTDSGWDGPIASVTGLGSRFRIDTGRLSLAKDDVKTPRIHYPYLRRSYSFPSGVAVRAVDPIEASVEGGSPRIELVRPSKPPQVLVKKAHCLLFFPSPDGKLVAMRWAGDLYNTFGASEKEDRIVVISARGEVVADLNVGE